MQPQEQITQTPAASESQTHDSELANLSSHLPNVAEDARRNLLGCSRRELEALVAELGQPKFRAKQLESWIWDKGVTSFDEMTNLPKALRAGLAQTCTLRTGEEAAALVSADGSRKYLLRYDDGASVECVGMPSGNRLAACVSTQAGCAMGCAFCATGASGLTRSLTAAEMVEQVLHVRDDFGARVTSVVMMGQGEPFVNYDQTLMALRRLNDPAALGIGARHLTVSTCGVIPMIARFSREPEQFTLAVSLHSAVQRTRDALMPGVKRWSLLRLYDVMGEYADRTGRRPTYEYALIRGVNDTEEELTYLCDFCRDTLCHVNLIQLNEVPGSRFEPSPQRRVQDFARRLESVGVETTIRNSRGADIDAACGQLRQRLG